MSREAKSPRRSTSLYIFFRQSDREPRFVRWSNPGILWGWTEWQRALFFRWGRRRRSGNEGKWSHRQAGSGFQQGTPRQTSISNCHQRLYLTGCQFHKAPFSKRLTVRSNEQRHKDNHTALIKVSLTVWGSIIRLSFKSQGILHSYSSCQRSMRWELK